MDSEMIVQIASIFITLVGVAFTYILLPLLKSKLSIEKQKHIEYWVRFAVGAAEQIFKGTNMGKMKKEYVIKFLEKKNIDLTIEELDILIEAIVNQIKNNKMLLN